MSNGFNMFSRRKTKAHQKEADRLIKESKGTEDIVSIGFSMVSSALAARKQSTEKDRLAQYTEDLSILLEGLNTLDTCLLNMYLADFSAGLVEVLAAHLGLSDDECIQNMALALEELKSKPS